MQTTYLKVLLLGLVLAWAGTAQAGFVGGVESFDGTGKDTDTWEEYTADGGSASRDYEGILQLDTKADYTTKTFTVGVGEYVRVYLNANSAGYYGINCLFLTNDSLGTTGRTVDDSRLLAVMWSNYSAKIFSRVKIDDSEDDVDILTGQGSLNGFWFQIERLSGTEARFSAFDSGMNPVGTAQTRTFSDVPDNLYISMYTGSSNCDYDNVMVGTIPEPATMGLIILGGLILRRRGR